MGFGIATALAVAGSMTPTGQGMLGQRHSHEKVAPVSSIQDKPAAIPGPPQSIVAAPVAQRAVPAPAPVPSVSPARSSAGRPPQATPSAPRPAPSQNGSGQNGAGGMAGIANILLNLPQILDQTRVGPTHDQDSWSEPRPAPADQGASGPHKKKRPDQHKEAGENN